MKQLKRLAGICTVAVAAMLYCAGWSQAGLLSNFEDGTAQNWVVDPGAGSVTLTPDNTKNGPSLPGSTALRVDVATGGFHFGVMRYDQGAVNPHHPNWLPPNTRLLFDVMEGSFTDFHDRAPFLHPQRTDERWRHGERP